MSLATDQREEDNGITAHSGIRHLPARLLSVIFHPLFVPVYVTVYLLFFHPMLFSGYEDQQKWRLLATVVVNLTFLPAVTVLLSWRLGFISGVTLKTQRERIIPLAAAMIFYFWCWFVLKNFTEIPALFRQFLLGTFITIIAAWLANIRFKVSLHGLAMGGMTIFFILLVFGAEGGVAWHLGLVLFIAGLVATARLHLAAHHPFEVYAGLFLGAFSQFLAVWL